MDNRPFSIFSLTEEQALDLLSTPPEQLEDPGDRYIAAAQLVNYPGERTIKALLAVIPEPVKVLQDRIVRRKAVETLGYLKAPQALQLLHGCLQDDDRYTIDNAVWSIGEIGTEDESILVSIAQLLEQPGQNYRLVIQTLTKLGYVPALTQIRSFMSSEDLAISGAAIAAVFRLAGDDSQMGQVLQMLQHESPNVRRSCIQDLVDARQYTALAQIAQCPISISFRLRGIRLLAEAGMSAGVLSFAHIEPILDTVIRDHPQDLEFVHEYDQTPSLEFVLNELYSTDFGRCYLAAQTLLEVYPQAAPTLMQEYSRRAKGDYGAHYHVIKLLGCLKHVPAYDLCLEALHNPAPQFLKSRTAAAIALGNLGEFKAVPELQGYLNSDTWALSYACILSLKSLNAHQCIDERTQSCDFLVEAKMRQLTF